MNSNEIIIDYLEEVEASIKVKNYITNVFCDISKAVRIFYDELFPEYTLYCIIPIGIIMAQSAWETGWGLGGIYPKTNNYFGLRPGSNYNGEIYETESNGSFRKYDEGYLSLVDYLKVLYTTGNNYSNRIRKAWAEMDLDQRNTLHMFAIEPDKDQGLPMWAPANPTEYRRKWCAIYTKYFRPIDLITHISIGELYGYSKKEDIWYKV